MKILGGINTKTKNLAGNPKSVDAIENVEKWVAKIPKRKIWARKYRNDRQMLFLGIKLIRPDDRTTR